MRCWRWARPEQHEGRGLTSASTWKSIYRQACRRHTAAHDTRSSAPVAKPGSSDPPVNGDQVRDTLICRQGPRTAGGRGLPPATGQRSAPPRRGTTRRRGFCQAADRERDLPEAQTWTAYDIDAVDWFLDQFLLLPGHDDQAGSLRTPGVTFPLPGSPRERLRSTPSSCNVTARGATSASGPARTCGSGRQHEGSPSCALRRSRR